MFFGSIIGGAGLNSDPDEERDPPPEPTPVVFPATQAHQSSEDDTHRWADQEKLPNFPNIYAKISKPADVTDEHLTLLNLEVLPPCSSTQDLLPSVALDGTSYFPSLQPPEHVDPDGLTYVDQLGSEPRPVGKLLQFHERLTELTVANDTAYRTITRTTKAGMKAPKLTYMRKLFTGLESMSPYWDCELDRYYEVPEAMETDEGGGERLRLDSGAEADILDSSGKHLEGRHSPTRDGTDDKVKPGGPAHADSLAGVSSTASPIGAPQPGHQGTNEPTSMPSSLRTRMRYKGRRTSTGRDMPDPFRAETVKGFTEGVIWPFQCTLSAPRHQPLVQFGKLNVPVRQTAAVYRLPTDRIQARQGCLEGPLLCIQVRPDTDFDPLELRSRMDFMREVGALLQIAQERRREGREQVKPGEGKWWTTKPRWGGGPGGEVENIIGNSDVVEMAGEMLQEQRGKDGGKGRKRKTPAMLWKELKCGSGNWDPKTTYLAMGKPDSKYDEVFMVSSLNHHISILKLTVHESYVDYLTSGTLPESVTSDTGWCRPRLERSKWFNLFDVEQRTEAFQSLWAVMSYLTRGPTASAVSSQEVKMGNE